MSPSRQRLAELLRRPRLARLLAVLNGDGEETRLVGGAVRNALIGRPVSEFDLASTALPEEVTRRAEAAGFKPVPTGIEHGTVTVVVEGEPFEVTTLREDVETDGRRARVRFGRDFEADARRRDFTVNALSVGADGTLFDYTGGFEDLEARRIRFIGDPAARIREDYLRILRFFRFHAIYAEGAPDPEDGSALEAACREAEEEIGLSRRFVRPLGYLDAYLSGTNYLVTPVVARVEPGYTLALNPDEVAATFEVPLRFLMDAANHQLHEKELRGRRRRYYAMPYGAHYIWGVTAGIIRNLYERLYGP